MVGIRDIAKHLDLSIWTVSRALNGKSDVSEDTRRRVLAAAEELDYQPNYSGISLRTGRTGFVGFLMRSGSEVSVDSSMFFLGVIDGVQAALSAEGIDVVALLYPSDGDPDQFLRRAVARRFVDALIVTGTRPADPRVAFLEQKGIPFVTLGRSGPNPGCLWFDADIDGMAEQAADRLLRAGHRYFALIISDDGENFYDVFVRAFTARVVRAGIDPAAVAVLAGSPSESDGHALAKAAVSAAAPPTALVIPHEAMTLGAYGALRQMGLTLGRDIALIGRDSPQTRFLHPSITRFRLPLREIGIEMGRGLLSIMPGQKAPAGDARPFRQKWDAEVIAGESDQGHFAG